MRHWALALLLLAAPAHAQDGGKSVESVTVTGTRAHGVIRKFVKNLAAPAPVSGKVTRWQDGICPQTVGLAPSAVRFVNARLKAVAKQVGAPVNTKPHCRVNIEIVFTTTPQAMIDDVRERQPELLGYAQNAAQIAALAKVSQPIQAWYLTQTRDIYGSIITDIAHRRDATMAALGLPDAIVVQSTGSRLGNGLTSAFQHVIVVADPTRLTDYPIGQVADAIALLALSHVSKPEDCQPLASILNLLAPGCKSVPAGLSAGDLAYLRGLYRRMQPGLSAGLQRQEIASQIEEAAASQ